MRKRKIAHQIFYLIYIHDQLAMLGFLVRSTHVGSNYNVCITISIPDSHAYMVNSENL
jgi:hypothetical protein